jgi:tripartite-type tricarboxylate transporter receptor subunit TctC
MPHDADGILAFNAYPSFSTGQVTMKAQFHHLGIVVWAMAGFGNLAFGQAASAPMRMLVGFPAGSAADGAARALGESLKESLGQTVVVDNRPGAGGRIAADLLKHSSPDGGTLLLAPMGTTIFFPAYVAKLSYDPWKDFVHVSQ